MGGTSRALANAPLHMTTNAEMAPRGAARGPAAARTSRSRKWLSAMLGGKMREGQVHLVEVALKIVGKGSQNFKQDLNS
jgi:hypothetical protein